MKKLYQHLPDGQANAVLNALEAMNIKAGRAPFTSAGLHQAKSEVQQLINCLHEFGYQVTHTSTQQHAS